MQPITRYDEFVQHQFHKLLAEQQKTNELLEQIFTALKPPVKEVEPIERKRNDFHDKRQRR
jgi:hypothetical protein